MTRKQKLFISLVVSLAAIALVFSSPAWAKVEGDTILFGAAVSFTGKYSTNGKHTKNGYDLAVKRINEAEGDIARFNALYTEYLKAPEVTKQRIYIETMREVLPNLGRKIIIDEEASQILPLLQLSTEAARGAK